MRGSGLEGLAVRFLGAAGDVAELKVQAVQDRHLTHVYELCEQKLVLLLQCRKVHEAQGLLATTQNRCYDS